MWRQTCFHPTPKDIADAQKHTNLLCTALCNVSQIGKLDEILWASRNWQVKPAINETIEVQKSTVYHLRSLLSNEKRGSKHLNAKQRRQVAVTLACSVLQFYESPWMHDFWDEEDIFFFAGANTSNRIDISDPCFSRNFPRQKPEDGKFDRQMSTHFLDLHIPNKPLFALGIVLMALCLNKPFAELQGANESELDPFEKRKIVDENL
jgi:hypothetical protein